jgi:hypothetical protein
MNSTAPLYLNFHASRAALAWELHSLPDSHLQLLIDRANRFNQGGPLRRSDVERTRYDLRSLIGTALSEARRQIKSTQAYAQWRKLNGLGAIPARACTEMRTFYEVDPFPQHATSARTEILEELVRQMGCAEAA